MKAIIAREMGGPEVLKQYEVDEPEVKQGEVKIRVRTFGLNKAEMYNRQGGHGAFSGKYALGIEAAGEVIEDPSGELAVGQKIITAMGGMMFTRHGSYAEITCVNKSNVQAINSDIDFVSLATLPQAYLTAWGAIDYNLKLAAGETLLVRGGTSTVGLASIVYAKLQGANVIATTRSEANRERLIAAGADHVLIDNGNIEQEVKSIIPNGADKAIELVGAATVKDTMNSLRLWGEVAFVGFLAGKPVIEEFHLMNDLPNTIKLSFFGSGILGEDALPISDSPLPKIVDLLQQGKIPSIYSTTFESTEIQKAHELLAKSSALGKIIMTH